MNLKMILALLIVSSMLSVSGAALANPGNYNHNPSIRLQGSPSIFAGNVTVYPNGTISSQSAPISRSGQLYTLTGNINGSLRFEASNAILNGNSFSILGNNGSNPALLISNSSVVTAANLTVISRNASAAGLIIVNTSMDNIYNVNVTAPTFGLLISGSTFDVNVSNSRVSVGGDHSPGMVAVVAGGDIGPGQSVSPVSGARNISLYANAIRNAGGQYGILINSPNSSLRDSTVTMTGKTNASLGGSILILADQNNTNVADNVLEATNVSLAVAFGNFSSGHYLYTGEEFNANTLTIISPAPVNSFGFTSGLVSFYSILTITGNHIYAKNMISDSNLFFSVFGDVAMANNTVSIANSTNVNAFYSVGGNVTVDSNSILYSQNSSLMGNYVVQVYSYSAKLSDNSIVAGNASAGSALVYVSMLGTTGAINTIYGNLLESTNSSAYGIVFNGTDASISQNVLDMNGSEPNGIVVSGTNLTVSSNEINIKSGSSSTGIGDFYSGYDFFLGIDNSNISGNTINITGDATGQIFGMYLINSIQHLGITANYIYSNDSKFKGIDFGSSSMNNVSISQNSIIYSPAQTSVFNGLSVNNGNSVLINGNTILSRDGAGMGAGSYALTISSSAQIIVSNNTMDNTNTTAIIGGTANMTFYGNYLINEYTALSMEKVDDALIYHNNFENFTVGTTLQTLVNVSFNASYPVGGNYWSNYTGVDHYSGSGQNLPGPDGIGDTPYIINATLKDNYPLMKPWSRPMVTFTETGLAPGQEWVASFNGKTVVTNQKSISFAILNATYQNYTYSVGKISGYTGGGQSGTFNYTGSGFSENVAFLEFAELRIKVSPLNATIIINGQKYSTDNGSFNISLAAGNYSIQFERPGYNTDSINLTLTAGEVKYVNISLTQVAGSNYILYYALAGIAAVVVASLAFYFARRKSR